MKKRGVNWVAFCLLLVVLLLPLIGGCSSAVRKEDSKSAASAPEAKNQTMQSGSAQFGSDAAKGKESGALTLADTSKSVEVKGQAAAPASSAAPGTGFAGGDPGTGDAVNRKLIYKANLTMKVEDYGKAQSDIRDLVALAGGYIVQYSENENASEQGGSFVFKVPAQGFSSFLKDLDKLPRISIQRNIQGQDVSEEYVDLEARLKAKQVQEARFLEFMQKASKSDELVSFANELGKIQEEIERIKGRMRYIDQNVAFSTVELRLYQPLKGKGSAEETAQSSLAVRAKEALSASVKAISTVVQALFVFAAGALPVAAVGAVVAAPVWWGYRRHKAKVRELTEEARRQRLEQNRKPAAESQQPETLSTKQKEGL